MANRFIVSGSRAVAIVPTASGFLANLYVNCERVPAGQFQAHHLGDITLVRKSAKRIETIEAWAAVQLVA